MGVDKNFYICNRSTQYHQMKNLTSQNIVSIYHFTNNNCLRPSITLELIFHMKDTIMKAGSGGF